MAKYAFVENLFVKEIVDSVPQGVHKDLQKMYYEIPAHMEVSVAPKWRFVDGTFQEPLSDNIVNSYNTLISWVRQERNKLLVQTDKYLITDYPITKDNLTAIKVYRQSLRDMPDLVADTAKSVSEVKFPKNPLID